MKWKKLGKIFDPIDHNLLGLNATFSQSPQAIVFEDFVRIYFSTREQDSSGKFLSHVAYVDMDKHFTKTLGVSKREIIPLGKTGCFDEHGIFPFSPVKVGNKIYAYTSGWNRKKSVSTDVSVGLAISHDDGETFEKFGDGPVLTSSLFEPFLVADSFVRFSDDQFHMWYIFGESWSKYNNSDDYERVYKIAYASSTDGKNWHRDSKKIISNVLGPDECQALPTVFQHNNLYHMYFCYRHATGFRTEKDKGYRIGYAFSEDMKNWTRRDEDAGITVSENDWDSDMQCYPYTFKCNNDIYMLYNGNQFGKDGFGIAVLEQE